MCKYNSNYDHVLFCDSLPVGALVFKDGYDARTRKQVTRVVFFF